MWKCAKRSLTVTFKRGVLSAEPPQNEELGQLRQNCLLKLTPAVIEHYNQFCNAWKHTYENYIKGKKDRERPKEKTWFAGVFDSDFFCALKWGGVFTLGYTFVQYKVKIFSHLDFTKQEFYTTNRYQKSLEYLIDSAAVKPYNYVIPEVQAAKSKNGRQQFPPQNLKSDEVNFSGLEEAYKKVSGVVNNNIGIQYMQSGQYKEALEHFIQSAEESHAPGIFNLGICHEKGLGTSQDFKKAAELYQRAADLGHATALYNLGVFYAQGKGGIQVDVNHARELFKTAASLGQVDAIKALNLESQATGGQSESDSVSDTKQESGNSLSRLIYKELQRSSLNFLQHFNIDMKYDDEVNSSCDSLEYSQGKEISSSLGSDSGVLDLSPESEHYVRLI